MIIISSQCVFRTKGEGKEVGINVVLDRALPQFQRVERERESALHFLQCNYYKSTTLDIRSPDQCNLLPAPDLSRGWCRYCYASPLGGTRVLLIIMIRLGWLSIYLRTRFPIRLPDKNKQTDTISYKRHSQNDWRGESRPALFFERE